MVTLVLVGLLALVAFAYIAVPLLVPGQADPLPDERDPVAQDLEEERDALFRAIRELEVREDLPEARREELRARYEAKAAHVLRALDEREAELAGREPRAPRGRRRVPYAVVALLALVLLAAATLPSSVLPRVGPNANVTTTDVSAAKRIAALERVAKKDPSAKNLLALGDAYWNAQETDKAIAAYKNVVATISPVPAAAYKRLAAAYLQTDLSQAYSYLQKALAAAPGDPQTLFAMGEVAFARDDLKAAKSAFQRYLATHDATNTDQAKQQIALIDVVTPLVAKADADPSEANLMALADAYWSHGAPNRAVDVYVRVLTGPNADNPTALSRTGQVLFTQGRSADAITLLQRAAQDLGGPDKLDTRSLLMLGNAYYTQQQYQNAIDTWNLYVQKVGGPSKAGRVPDLIQSAKARQNGNTTAATPALPGAPAASGSQLFEANCAVCHGAAGQGGSGPALAGNARAANVSNVRDAIRFGRGMMPGFQGKLTSEQVDALVQYVTGTLAAGGKGAP
ncbi:MAG: c-type cytochrome [Deinococcales bacterium]